MESVLEALKLPQRQRICQPPGDAVLAVDALEKPISSNRK
jgi:hypothetical protein